MRGLERRWSNVWRSGSWALLVGLVATSAACQHREEPSLQAAPAAEERANAEKGPAQQGGLAAAPPPAPPAAESDTPVDTAVGDYDPVLSAPGGVRAGSGSPRKPSSSPQPLRIEGKAKGGAVFDQALGSPAQRAAGPLATAAPPPAQAELAIDPNGRFATTYRPGGGHLAAFESAVARGIVPLAERELVSDVGARYSPSIEPPQKAALTFRTEFERAKAPPSGGETHLRISLRSATTAAASRPHLSVHLVLDVSGSMRGEPILRAREAARALVQKLRPTDDFSLTTFSSDAQVKITDGPVGARRADILRTIEGIVEGGGTNIGHGLQLGYEQARGAKGVPADAVRVVLLMSDGRANSGILNSEQLSRMALGAFQDGIQTSAFGLGSDYDGALMSSIASDGAGGYYYLRDADQLSPALSTELDKRLDPVATAVELRVRLKPDVKLFHVYGSRRLSDAESARVRAQEVAADVQAAQRDKIKQDRQDDAQGGMRFFIPAFARDDQHAILLKLALPPGVGTRDVALVELKYKDRIGKKNGVEELPIKITYAGSDAESAASQDASVARTVQGFGAGETLAEASRLIANNDRERAIAILTEREGILRTAATTLSEPLFQKDADRLSRLRTHAGTFIGIGDPLVLAMLLETAARTHLR
ncbi:VWA domain-containing protein [Chondromyces crocatus]|uniref:VWFA domain-containing protein n=1 Tax=Chondromyces crocatus TaxID=52 RepID=A0A0K1E5P5_CHOCO|nr:VWA domain-containing protein [Chondromyces crocatus]AKT36012.1 uncharacterized protein CMC5_001240 [Chondromyces crocatus]